MNKRILSILLLTLMCFSIILSPIIVQAEENDNETQNVIYVYDNADILSKNEENTLQKTAKKYEEYDINVIFLTTNNLDDMTSSSYIEKFYKNNNFAPNGVVFFVSTDVDNYEAYIDTMGQCIDTLSIEQIENILNSNSYLATAGDYFEFFSNIEKESNDFIIKSTNTKPVFVPTTSSIAITIIVVIFFAIFLIAKHNAANKRPKAQIYLNQTFEVLSRNEVFIGDKKEVIKDYYKKDTRSNAGVGNIKITGRGKRF